MNVLVGRKAPDFTSKAVLPNGDVDEEFSWSRYSKNVYGLILFYPLNFTFVCPSELIALNNRLEEFKKRGVEVISVSIDSHFSHKAWRERPVKQGGIGNVGFTMVADMNHNICQAYGVEHPELGVAFRAAFLIDKDGIVRSQIVNDLPLGRNIDELIRLVDALQHHEEHGEVCPAGWVRGKEGMVASTDGVASYLANYAENL